MNVKLYLFQRQIEGQPYGFRVPCASEEEAKAIARILAADYLGSDVHEVSSIPAEQLMDFCSNISDETIRWKHNAAEQLEAFLSIGWPAKP